MNLPFARCIRCEKSRPDGYGFCWLRFETDEVVVAPLGLHIIYGAGYGLYLLWIRGLVEVNWRLARHLRRKRASAAERLAALEKQVDSLVRQVAGGT